MTSNLVSALVMPSCQRRQNLFLRIEPQQKFDKDKMLKGEEKIMAYQDRDNHVYLHSAFNSPDSGLG